MGNSLIAREGDPAPGTGSGVVFGDLMPDPRRGSQVSNALNNVGQLAFIASLTGPRPASILTITREFGLRIAMACCAWSYWPATRSTSTTVRA